MNFDPSHAPNIPRVERRGLTEKEVGIDTKPVVCSGKEISVQHDRKDNGQRDTRDVPPFDRSSGPCLKLRGNRKSIPF